MKYRRTAVTATVLAAASLLVTSCSAPSEAEPPTDEEIASVSGIPAEWLERTAAGWPDSEGYTSDIPVLSRDSDCLLVTAVPEMVDATAKMTDTGWGPYADDLEGYRYMCNFWAEGRYSGEISLIQSNTAENAEIAMERFDSQESTDVQDNTVETVQSHGLELSVLSRWYPTNPQGLYQAAFHDSEADAIVLFEINSLDETDYESLDPQSVADILVGLLAAG